MKKIFLFMLIFLIPFVVRAEELKLELEKQFDDISSLHSITATKDGNYILAGRDNSSSGHIYKIDKDGNILWDFKCGYFGRAGELYKTIETENGFFITVGFEVPAYMPNPILVKYDQEGNISYINKDENLGFISSVISSSDGFIVSGYLNQNGRDAFISKYDDANNLIFKKTIDGYGIDEFSSLIETSDEGLVAVGYTEPYDIDDVSLNRDYDAIIVKYSKEGNLLWQKNWGDVGRDVFNDIVETDDGGLLVIGYSSSTNISDLINKGAEDAILVKYDKDGNLLWQKSFGGVQSDFFSKLIKVNDGFVVSGLLNTADVNIQNSDSDNQIFMLKFEEEGNVIWQKNTEEENFSNISSIDIDNDNNLVVLGIKDGKNHMVKYSFEYELNIHETNSEMFTVVKDDGQVYIMPIKNEGYEIDKIIIKDKDGNVLDLVVTKQQDGTYSFELYEDVTVEVLFKETLVNPKTGVIDYVLILLGTVTMSLMLYFTIIKYESKNNINLGM